MYDRSLRFIAAFKKMDEIMEEAQLIRLHHQGVSSEVAQNPNKPILMPSSGREVRRPNKQPKIILGKQSLSRIFYKLKGLHTSIYRFHDN